MLENLRDFPRDFLDLYFQDYSDGIIEGVEVAIEEDKLIITKGIVKHQNRLYLLLHNSVIPYSATGKETILKIRFQEEMMELDFTRFTANIVLDELNEVASNELELGRFKLKPGARLRSKHEDFLDFATEYNTFNYIHCHYAGFQKSTYHPIILQYYARELLSNRPTNPYDISFAFSCINEDRVQRETILYYVSNRLGLEFKEYTNVQIHKYLSRILLESSGKKHSSELTYGRSKRMIVD